MDAKSPPKSRAPYVAWMLTMFFRAEDDIKEQSKIYKRRTEGHKRDRPELPGMDLSIPSGKRPQGKSRPRCLCVSRAPQAIHSIRPPFL